MVEGTSSVVRAGHGVDGQRAHAELVRLARSRAGLEFEEGQWLLVAERAGVHLRFGHGSFAEYVERLFGHSPRFTKEKLRVAAALERLPELAQALRTGATSWSAVRELTRVATPETERRWLESAGGKTVHQVEKLVSGRSLGSVPTDPAEPALERHVLRFEVSGEVLATVREALVEIRRQAGGPLDDDAALLLLARCVLSGPSDSGRASYQIALTVCEDCGRTHQTGRGEQVQVSAGTAEMARCDAQIFASIERAPDERARDENQQPHDDEDQDQHDDENQDQHDDETRVGPKARHGRAAQTIPPALRRAVLTRDYRRCQVPGCRHAHFVDVHHIQARAEMGQNEAENLVTLCSAHHRAVHRSWLRVQGRISSGLRFLHADGTTYGESPSPAILNARTRAFQGLRGMGFNDREVKHALAEVETHVGPALSLERLLRAALQVLTPKPSGRAS